MSSAEPASEVAISTELTPRPGEVLVLLGANDSGRTKLLHQLGERHAATTASPVAVGDRLGERPRVVAAGAGGLALPGSVYDNVALALRALRKPPIDLVDRVETALRQAALWVEVRDRLRQPAAQLSLGQRQRLELARALVLEPEVLLLDDVANGCDLVTTHRLEYSLRELCSGRVLILSTSDPLEARRVGDRTAFVSGGAVVEVAATEQLFTRPRDPRTAEYLGVPRDER